METTIGCNKNFIDPESRRALLSGLLADYYISIVELDLQTGYATLLKSSMDTELEGYQVSWQDLINRYAHRRAYPEDHAALFTLTLEKLHEIWEQPSDRYTMELRCINKDQAYDWVEISVSKIPSSQQKLLISTQNINENHMLKSIVNLFVYQNLDYLVLLDALHNSYTMFSGKKGSTTLPPVFCNNYSEELLRYNRKYVSPEDFDRVTGNMQIPHVLKMLEKEEKYSFQSGGITNNGGYRRTQLQFQYYDKAAQLILLTRMDITQAFQDEQARNEQLSKALRDAQHDALTGIFNQKATQELISSLLERQYRNKATLFFIDVDNFKMVNDTLGHQKGDELLRFLAQAIQEIAGRSGIAGRIGGDEFLVFLPTVASRQEILEHAKKICCIFDSFANSLASHIPLSCSIGISVYPHDGTDYQTLVRKADQALYTSKRYGKRQSCFYSQEPDSQSGICL